MASAFRTRRGVQAAAAAALVAACGRPRAPLLPPPSPLAEPVRVSGSSPYPAGCNPALPGAVNYPGAEVEPHLVVDPADPMHLVGAWQQDRWQGGGANGIDAGVSRDGGLTWTRTGARFTLCSGGAAGASYDRASDPWLAFASDGTVHQVALAFDDSWHGARQAVLVSRSADGGLTWSDPVAVASETTIDVALDKCTISSDPVRPGYVYAVWDRLAGLGGPAALQTGPAFLARSTDGGAHWEPPRAIHDPGPDAQTISNQVAVLPDGTLVNLLVIFLGSSSATPRVSVAVLRSVDAGLTWSSPIEISLLESVGTSDPDPQHPHAVRDGSIVPQIAADPASGRLYVVWQDARFSGFARDGIALSTSADGGLTWSAPAQVNQAAGVQAFTPSVAVAASGRIAVAYYDFRFGDPAPPGLWTVRWLAESGDGGATWDEVPAGGPFDLRLAPDAGGYFLGDYAGLAGLADSFVPFFAMSGLASGDRADVFALPATAAALPLPPRAAREQRVSSPRSLRDRLLHQREVVRARTPR
jgi:hypothetical protein